MQTYINRRALVYWTRTRQATILVNALPIAKHYYRDTGRADNRKQCEVGGMEVVSLQNESATHRKFVA